MDPHIKHLRVTGVNDVDGYKAQKNISQVRAVLTGGSDADDEEEWLIDVNDETLSPAVGGPLHVWIVPTTEQFGMQEPPEGFNYLAHAQVINKTKAEETDVVVLSYGALMIRVFGRSAFLKSAERGNWLHIGFTTNKSVNQ